MNKDVTKALETALINADWQPVVTTGAVIEESFVDDSNGGEAITVGTAGDGYVTTFYPPPK